jgi:hypothetical protein
MVADRFTSLYGAVLIGAAAGLVVFLHAISTHRVHMLDVVSVCYFGALASVVYAVQPHNLDTWARFAQAGSHGVVTLLVFGSILVGHPFTESYARAQVPERRWHRPEFRAANRKLSAFWGGAFLVGTASLVVAGVTDGRSFLLRLVIPFGALLLVFRYTQARTRSVVPSDQPA